MFDYVLNMLLSLVANKVWVDEEPISLILMKNQQKIVTLLNDTECGKCGAMDKNVECLWCEEIKVMEYFEVLVMRYGDLNAVTKRV